MCLQATGLSFHVTRGGSSFTPNKTLLSNRERFLNALSPEKRDRVYDIDIERGQVRLSFGTFESVSYLPKHCQDALLRPLGFRSDTWTIWLQVVNEWKLADKVGVDGSLIDIANETRDAQLDDRSTLLVLGPKR
jgi:hypothetical protein